MFHINQGEFRGKGSQGPSRSHAGDCSLRCTGDNFGVQQSDIVKIFRIGIFELK